jgi:hypothetical protein
VGWRLPGAGVVIPEVAVVRLDIAVGVIGSGAVEGDATTTFSENACRTKSNYLRINEKNAKRRVVLGIIA